MINYFKKYSSATSHNKPVILVFVDYYLPGFKGGGPIRSISNLVSELKHQYHFKIITRDRDLGDRCQYENISTNTWNSVDGIDVFYLSNDLFSIFKVIRLSKELSPDLVYLNSFFSPFSSIFPLLLLSLFNSGRLRSFILAPRGEFDKGALEKKRLKKMLYINFFSKLLLRDNIFWHLSNSQDMERLKELFKNVKQTNIFKVSNISNKLNIPVKSLSDLSSVISLCFLSRISPKKNLNFALLCLKPVRFNVDFHIYGPIEDKLYWQSCLEVINSLPSNINVHYHGAIDYKDVMNTIYKHDLFFLPTKGENYGHVIFEALCAGLPLLLSDQTPWSYLENHEWCTILKLDSPEEFSGAINKFAQLSKTERHHFHSNVLSFSASLDNKSIVEDHKQMFDKICLY